jgi:putative ATP-dependent endonuclease of the OLD family
MRLLELRIQNYRTITNLHLKFPSYYTAVCGRNDAGKTNLIRVLRSAFQRPEGMFIFQQPDISIKEDFPKWLEPETTPAARCINVSFELEISKDSDEGLHRFIQDYLALPEKLQTQAELRLNLSLKRSGDGKAELVSLSIEETPYDVNKAQEVYKRLQSSLTFLFHDSTEFFHPYRFRQATGIFRDMSSEDDQKVKEAQLNLSKTLNRVVKRNQQDLTEMLGRLKDKYKIGLSIANPDFSDLPYTITLGTEDGEVELENWGSGTQNRTRILMTLFRAKQIRESHASSDKLTPVIIVEEPESYLHPSAQAEFGKTLRNLAEEFKIQVIVTTHSPYLLSFGRCEANILLERKIEKKRARETQLVEVSGEKWMEPFSRVLGIHSRAF